MSALNHFRAGEAELRIAVAAMVQVTAIILIAALMARASLKHNPAARHGLWLGALIWILISPITVIIADRAGLALGTLKIPFARVRPAASIDQIHSIANADHVGSDAGVPLIERASFGTSALVTIDSPKGSLTVGPELASQIEQGKPQAVRTAVHGGPRPELIWDVVWLIWAAGLLIILARLVAGWLRLASMMRFARPLDSVKYAAPIAQAGSALGVVEMPPIVTSRAVAGPVAVGLFRPKIILPEGLAEALTEQELRDVLVHEGAHVLRCDPWIGLLQRLAAALYWPHPLVHYLNTQLARSREEVCDNFVVRCSGACGYSRTLLALTELCRPRRATRPGLGLFGLLGARWTLADRVAGLLDPRRAPMTRSTVRMKIAITVALAATGLSLAALRPELTAHAAEQEASQPKQAVSPKVASPLDEVWRIQGVVVDEQGRPVAGAVVRSAPEATSTNPVSTAADGKFVLTFGGSIETLRGVSAEADGGGRIGLVRDGLRLPLAGPAKIVLKPSQKVTVRVKDTNGAPVDGAVVEAVDYSFQTHATTGPDGSASLRIAADAVVEYVVGHKAGVGFDFYESNREGNASDTPPLPDEVVVTLDGATSVKVTVVDSKGEPVQGLVFGPGTIAKRTGKPRQVNSAFSTTLRAKTDEKGVAVFDWFPKDCIGASFHIVRGMYYTPDSAQYRENGPKDLTLKVLRLTRLSGKVRLPSGQPAPGILVRANGEGPTQFFGHASQLTNPDGTYALEVFPEQAYALGVDDDNWAAVTRMDIVVREGQEQDGLDFDLIKGTLVRGRITEPDGQPSAGTLIQLIDQGPLVPKDLRGRFISVRRIFLPRRTTTDDQGRYHFRVPAGQYALSPPPRSGTRFRLIEIGSEPEAIFDISLKGPPHPASLDVLVVEIKAGVERPVAGALVGQVIRGGQPRAARNSTDDKGRVRMTRDVGELGIYARNAEGSLASFVPVAEGSRDVKIVITHASTVSGRVIDTNGRPHAMSGISMQLDSGSIFVDAFHTALSTRTDEQGRFSFSGIPPGSQGEISVPHRRDAGGMIVRTVMRFLAYDLAPVELKDLIIPPTGPLKNAEGAAEKAKP